MPKYKRGDLLTWQDHQKWYWYLGYVDSIYEYTDYEYTMYGKEYAVTKYCYVFKYVRNPKHGMFAVEFIDKRAILIKDRQHLERLNILFSKQKNGPEPK